MQKVNGRALADACAEQLKNEYQSLENQVILGLVVVGDNAVTNQFVKYKKKMAERLGVQVQEFLLPENCEQNQVKNAVRQAVSETDGVVVQLPLPSHIDTQEILDSIPASHDPDVLSSDAYQIFLQNMNVLPPVTAAIDEIFHAYNIALADRRVVVIGQGNLVGRPTADYCEHQGAEVSRVDIDTSEDEKRELLGQADIVISGVGSPDLVTGEMIKQGVVLIDAGTSNDQGVVRGDIAQSAIEKSSVYSTTPGGVGPLTVVMLFKNLLTLVNDR